MGSNPAGRASFHLLHQAVVALLDSRFSFRQRRCWRARIRTPLLHGTLDVESGGHSQRVRHGETVRYAADVRHAIRNAGKVKAVALLVVINP